MHPVQILTMKSPKEKVALRSLGLKLSTQKGGLSRIVFENCALSFKSISSMHVCSRRRADLTLSHLSSLKSLDRTENDSAYAKNGKDPKRIKHVLKNKQTSGCQCSRERRAWF